MRRIEQVKKLWELGREQSAEGQILRRRIAAIGALAVAACGFLLAVGLAILVLLALAAGAVLVVVALLPALWPRARGALRTASVKARARGSGLGRAAAASGSRVRRTARATAIRFVPQPGRPDEREATRLNAAGTQHRRSGRFEEAVECHRNALEILRMLGDRRGVALTQSNLALALSRTGDDEWSVGLLEEAAATLHELGDEEHEAQIMANLGLTHRRHGRNKEGDNVLELALSKLSPASSAYQAIAAELRRAS